MPLRKRDLALHREIGAGEMTVGRGGQERRLRVMWKAIVEGIKGRDMGGRRRRSQWVLVSWLCEERAKKCEPAAGRRVYRVEVRGSVVSKVG